MALFPATFAGNDDAILLLDRIPSDQLSSLPHHDILSEKNITILSPDNIKDFIKSRDLHVEIIPWGWNHTLLSTLRKCGVDSRFTKSSDEIDTIRRLAHRATTIPFRNLLLQYLPALPIDTVSEFKDVASAMDFLRINRNVYFKLPWSSSGRGVLNSSSMNEKEIEAWLRGGIKRQGSVIGEIARTRNADFASEWWLSDGIATFLGLSLFNTTSDGRYIENVIAPQSRLREMISSFYPDWDDSIIQAQKYALENIVAPYYSGPVGIDMFSTTDGDLNPCVELNLRITMGLASIWQVSNQ